MKLSTGTSRKGGLITEAIIAALSFDSGWGTGDGDVDEDYKPLPISPLLRVQAGKWPFSFTTRRKLSYRSLFQISRILSRLTFPAM